MSVGRKEWSRRSVKGERARGPRGCEGWSKYMPKKRRNELSAWMGEEEEDTIMASSVAFFFMCPSIDRTGRKRRKAVVCVILSGTVWIVCRSSRHIKGILFSLFYKRHAAGGS